MKQRFPSLSEFINESNLKDVKKGSTIEFIVPGTNDMIAKEKVIDIESSRSEDFAVVMHNNKKIFVPFANISNIIK